MAWNWNNRRLLPRLPPAPPGVTWHECPICGELFFSSHGLGCHLSWHRRNPPVARRAPPAPPAPAAPLAVVPLSVAPPAPNAVPAVDTLPRLAPNPAFWEEYRWGGAAPAEIDFMGQLAAAPTQPVVLNGGDVPESSGNAGQPPVDVTSSKE